MQRSTYSPVQAVLQVELLVPPDHVAEQVAEDRRVLGEQGFQVEGAVWW